ncbi:MAG: hypothetical protein MUE42_13485, partial [Opitutaceae bacterium]|nr:hypothetical protein [Opitutaceae bacterium]
GALPAAQVAGPVLRLSFQRIADPTLTYVVEASSSLAPAAWATVWSSTGSANVAGPVTVDDTAPLATNPLRFLRLRIAY